MEDTDKLLKTAIDLHYHDRPEVVVKATRIIQEYGSKEQSNSEYDKVLKTLHDLMNDLPPNILIYFLTTVPLPKEKGKNNSTFSELMKKSRVPLIENMQSVLTTYINNARQSPVIFDGTKSSNVKSEGVTSEIICSELTFCTSPVKTSEEGTDFSKPCSSYLKRPNEDNHLLEHIPTKKNNMEACEIIDITNDSCKNLLEICADFVLSNMAELKYTYDTKNKTVWDLVNKNICNADEQNQCYDLIRDINKKLKWLRMIDAGYFSAEAIKEEYGESEIFLKERGLCNLFDEDAYTVTPELREAIENFLSC